MPSRYAQLAIIFALSLSTLSAVADEQINESLSESTASKGTRFSVNPLKDPEINSGFSRAAENIDIEQRVAVSLLDHDVRPGSFERLYWTAGQAVAGLAMPTPVLVAAGINPGPTLCLTAAVHGDELNGVETIRRVMFSLESDKLNGVVIGVPIVNMHGFRRSSRYLPDRRDLNRYFPGDAKGSSAGRIAQSFFQEIITRCDRLIDIHTGSFHRTNLTQLRGDLGKESVKQFSKMFNDVMVLDGAGASGTLRKAAVNAGIPAVTLEAGEPLRLQLNEVKQSVDGIMAVLHHMGMIDDKPPRRPKQLVFYKSTWLRASQSGVFLSEAELGQTVKKGDILGTVTDPITNRSSVIRSDVDGKIIGMALNQMVMPGFAAYHMGIFSDERQAVAEKAAESAVAEALEPVAEELKEAAREAAEAAAKATDDPEKVSEAVRKAVKAAAKDAAKDDGEKPANDSADGESPNAVDDDGAAPASPEQPVEKAPQQQPTRNEMDEHPE